MRKHDMNYGDIIMEAANNVAGEDYDSLEEAQVALLQEMNRISDDDDDMDDLLFGEDEKPGEDYSSFDLPMRSPRANKPFLSDIFNGSIFGDPGDLDKFMKKFEKGCKSVGIKPKHGTYSASGEDLQKVSDFMRDHWDDDEDDKD